MRHYYSTSEFTYNKDEKKFVTEISSLSRGHQSEVFHQVFGDSCDLGFTLVSDRTGVEAEFMVDRMEEREGEIILWKLVPTRGTVADHPSLRGVTIIVFND